MGRAADSAHADTREELTSRMNDCCERAVTARRLARAISDKRATQSLLDYAETFEKEAAELADKIALLPPKPTEEG